jgi:hypothetical protein
MNNNIFPSHIVRTTNSDGSNSSSEIYSIEAIANQGLLFIIFWLILFGLFFPFVSVILGLIYIYIADESPKLLSLFGIAICVYLLYDIKHEWFLSLLISQFSTGGELNNYVKITMGMLIVHSIYLLFGDILFELSFRKHWLFLIYSIIIWISSYFIGCFILTDFIKINFIK